MAPESTGRAIPLALASRLDRFLPRPLSGSVYSPLRLSHSIIAAGAVCHSSVRAWRNDGSSKLDMIAREVNSGPRSSPVWKWRLRASCA
jgi:hypothetical protein